MFPNVDPLPQLKCSRPGWGRRGSDEAGEHGDAGLLVAAVIERYSNGRRAEKGRILDEFVAVTGFHRKHAMRVLRGGQADRRSAPRPGAAPL
jgi:hypothetical protein